MIYNYVLIDEPQLFIIIEDIRDQAAAWLVYAQNVLKLPKFTLLFVTSGNPARPRTTSTSTSTSTVPCLLTRIAYRPTQTLAQTHRQQLMPFCFVVDLSAPT